MQMMMEKNSASRPETRYSKYAPIVNEYLANFYPLVTKIKKERRLELENRTEIGQQLQHGWLKRASEEYSVLKQANSLSQIQIANRLGLEPFEFQQLEQMMLMFKEHQRLSTTNYYDFDRRYPLQDFIYQAFDAIPNGCPAAYFRNKNFGHVINLNLLLDIIAQKFGFYDGHMSSYQDIAEDFMVTYGVNISPLDVSNKIKQVCKSMQNDFFHFSAEHRFDRESWLEKLRQSDECSS